jgi:hypothetical protein
MEQTDEVRSLNSHLETLAISRRRGSDVCISMRPNKILVVRSVYED